MPSSEQGVPIQADTLTQAGPPVRTLSVTAIQNGLPVTVQMQVVSIADEHGVVFAQPYEPRQLLMDIANILKDIRVMMSKLSDMPFADAQEGRGDVGGVQF